jgi:aryl-alcohol dehydrogenase-like predicted oxidoreductase
MSGAILSRRHYRDEVNLSILGFGGLAVAGMEQRDADDLIQLAKDYGVNYFDVAPSYGNGDAERKLGVALKSCRADVFLAGKTMERSAGGARADLSQSLRNLSTDYFDLYQFHAIASLEEVDEIFASGGALEAVVQARDEGKVHYLGFSAHSVDAALAMLNRFAFDSFLFPINYVCYAQGNFGPQVLKKAREQGVACIALKAMALGPRRPEDRSKYPNCWYHPIEDRSMASKALRFALSEDVTAALPPADARLYHMALDFARDFTPLTSRERSDLLASSKGYRPLMRA